MLKLVLIWAALYAVNLLVAQGGTPEAALWLTWAAGCFAFVMMGLAKI